MAEMTKLLFECNIDIETSSKDSRTTLHLAADRNG